MSSTGPPPASKHGGRAAWAWEGTPMKPGTKSRARAWRVGAFALLSLVLLATAIVLLAGGRWWTPTDAAVMRFAHSVYGLKPGAPVVFRGVQLGTVSSIGLAPLGAPRCRGVHPGGGQAGPRQAARTAGRRRHPRSPGRAGCRGAPGHAKPAHRTALHRHRHRRGARTSCRHTHAVRGHRVSRHRRHGRERTGRHSHRRQPPASPANPTCDHGPGPLGTRPGRHRHRPAHTG